MILQSLISKQHVRFFLLLKLLLLVKTVQIVRYGDSYIEIKIDVCLSYFQSISSHSEKNNCAVLLVHLQSADLAIEYFPARDYVCLYSLI